MGRANAQPLGRPLGSNKISNVPTLGYPGGRALLEKKRGLVSKGLRNNYLEVGVGGGGRWEMDEICPKTRSYLPSHEAKNNFTPPPHIMIILRLLPLEKSLLPLIPVVGVLPPLQTSLQIALRRMSKSHVKSHQNYWTELVSSSHELGDSSSSAASLALRFSRAWVRTRSINSALLPLILRPF